MSLYTSAGSLPTYASDKPRNPQPPSAAVAGPRAGVPWPRVAVAGAHCSDCREGRTAAPGFETHSGIPRFPPAVLPISKVAPRLGRAQQQQAAAAPRASACMLIQQAGPLRQGGWRRRLLLLEEQEELLSLAAVGLPSSNIYERLAQRSALLLTSSRSRRRWRQPPQRQGRRGSASQASAACWLAPASGAARCCYPCHQAATYLRQCSQSQS
jgi:hypothetical protein